ncbi:hypothetical protein LAD77_01365 [Klebsiella pneumoniae]|nr:hypothetical protein [Klebsiella pneumoniae]
MRRYPGEHVINGIFTVSPCWLAAASQQIPEGFAAGDRRSLVAFEMNLGLGGLCGGDSRPVWCQPHLVQRLLTVKMILLPFSKADGQHAALISQSNVRYRVPAFQTFSIGLSTGYRQAMEFTSFII